LQDSFDDMGVFRHQLLHSDEGRSPCAACRSASYRNGPEASQATGRINLSGLSGLFMVP
jgi:hypothetical protein